MEQTPINSPEEGVTDHAPVFDAEYLKDLAKSYSKPLKTPVQIASTFSDESLEPFMTELSEYLKTAAENGLYHFYYDFESKDIDLMHAVAHRFRTIAGEGFMVIVNTSVPNIKIDWSGISEV